MKIELEPCYPEGSTSKEQFEYIKCEYQELMDAIDNECWENVAHEALDVAQTVEGYQDIVVLTKYNTDFKHEIVEVKYLDFINKENFELFWSYYNNGICDMSELKWVALNYFYKLVCNNNQGDKEKQEVIDRLLQEHKDKLESRRKEWAK